MTSSLFNANSSMASTMLIELVKSFSHVIKIRQSNVFCAIVDQFSFNEF